LRKVNWRVLIGWAATVIALLVVMAITAWILIEFIRGTLG